ncbi:TetR/AcrR family transcriptional regulator [Demequina sp. TMPB413]|uniref:TetR/AcrR family transcriptional regulator n=1 Tax=Demequina sp. TMPB413 TaxID=2881056 RepID=UPI00200A556B|nr:TetR/AcrR family transcriptional regulator [Demequina sp. TMPB413]UPU87200.1 TetR/AcrR family transcriptional regulator [Demequina sp. TMPB413]
MDARIVRTRRRLQEALLSLARERGLEHVAISDITERAGVNRSTFYQHYADKDTVLADALDRIAGEAGARLEIPLLQASGPPEPLVAFLAHIDEYADVYRSVFSGTGSGVVLARLRARVRDALDVALLAAQRVAPMVAPADVVAAGVAGSIVGVIGAWLEIEDRPGPREAAAWIWAIVVEPPENGMRR